MKRRVIVTGGSRGIGAACVKRFCSLGDRVVFIYRSRDCEASELARLTGAIPVKADLYHADQCRNAADEALLKLGGADVLVNCAGISYIGLFNEQSDEDIDRMIGTDLVSVIRFTKEITSDMIKNHSGRVINIGSVWGAYGASCEVTYSAAKAGVRGFTKALAKELGPSGITVNCVEPGVIKTEMNSVLSGDVLDDLIESTPLCRLGEADDVAAAVSFLASDDAAFITGAIIPVDGGFPA